MFTKQPCGTRAYLALSRPIPGSLLPRDNVPVFIRRPPKITFHDALVRAALRRQTAQALRRKDGGLAYVSALKLVSLTALPRIEGTLSLHHVHLGRARQATGMVC